MFVTVGACLPQLPMLASSAFCGCYSQTKVAAPFESAFKLSETQVEASSANKLLQLRVFNTSLNNSHFEQLQPRRHQSCAQE